MSTELDEIMYGVMHDHFVGTFPRDKTPQTFDRYPCGFILNTDKSGKPGLHWVSFFKASLSDPWVFWDSYGLHPSVYGIPLPNSRVIRSTQQVQCSDSVACGEYCVFFLVHMFAHWSLHEILNCFTKNCRKNDRFVVEFVNAKFQKHFRVFDKSVNQKAVDLSNVLRML